MGRGRAKAKQTKVARELKYFSPDTDLSALERELHSSTSSYEPEPSRGSGVDDRSPEDVGDDDEYGLAPDDVGRYRKWASGEQ